MSTKEAGGQIDVQSVYRVDTQWMVDSDLTEEEAVRFLFQTYLRRTPNAEEMNRMKDFFESSTDGRAKQFEDLNFMFSQMSVPVLGVYQFKGKDQLVICLAPPGDSRPKRFTTGKDGGEILIQLKRVTVKTETK